MNVIEIIILVILGLNFVLLITLFLTRGKGSNNAEIAGLAREIADYKPTTSRN